MKIIIVDDNILVLKQLGKHLQNQGHTVIENSNAMEALSNVLKHEPDLVISDILMPYLTGNELYKALSKKASTKTNMLFITSLQEKHISQLDTILTSDNVLQKPLNFKKLDQKIESMIS